MVIDTGIDSPDELELSDTSRVKEDPIKEQTLTNHLELPYFYEAFTIARLDVHKTG